LRVAGYGLQVNRFNGFHQFDSLKKVLREFEAETAIGETAGEPGSMGFIGWRVAERSSNLKRRKGGPVIRRKSGPGCK